MEEVAEFFSTDTAHGLSKEEAQRRLAEYGPNELPADTGPKLLTLIFRHTVTFIQMVLLAAAIASLAVQSWYDAGAIFILIVLNVFVGVGQEYSSERTLQALKNLSSPSARVIRDDHVEEIPSKYVVSQ